MQDFEFQRSRKMLIIIEYQRKEQKASKFNNNNRFRCGLRQITFAGIQRFFWIWFSNEITNLANKLKSALELNWLLENMEIFEWY